jgi:pimeloyl-ACP methyl ester carboxylesterase
MGLFKTENAEINYRTMGDGDVVLLVHGFGSSFSESWEATGWMDHLSALGRRVVAIDMRGHGGSGKHYEPEAYLPEVVGQEILSLMDHLSLDKVDLMGFSIGAWLCTYLLSSAPDRFRTGILGGVGDRFKNEPERGEEIARAMTTDTPKSIKDFTLRMIRDFAVHAGSDIDALAAFAKGINMAGPPALEAASQPILIVGGDKDDFVGPPDEIKTKLPDVAVHMLSGQDHLTLLMDPRFKTLVEEFLTNRGTE